MNAGVKIGELALEIPSQGQWLRQVVTGFFAYHAVPTNFDAWLRSGKRTLTRRGQKDRTG